ncbi:hypothetical protein CANARDRAFT_176364 [[Candida] arabinofermentans NRRL YB-2248]|uniref:ABC transporter domain-containing protein n=1 Tax=[Candida] arabinofermentans NRRL YB-2248 TaxID=983967 RepID=A0A1E4SZQ7_9ASCO|nr:hypothetical protein CANARDRAFT_176364 [[Candida] arabinofermentans NRRL YB-2248]
MQTEINSVSEQRLGSRDISFTKTDPVEISVSNLSISAFKKSTSKRFKIPILNRATKKTDIESNGDLKSILKSMSFRIPPNSLTCIIGGSGSGKTTLLNSLANKQISGSSLVKSGEITYNGMSSMYHLRHAYVIQQDILIPTLTCYETLIFAAELKLPKLTSKRERTQLVTEVLLELGLKECRNTMVGDRSNKGLSGGEKRRLSVAIQLISNPSILFLDEPTTGLDSYNAYLLCLSLKKLAEKLNKTVIMSIHQPRADIFKLFDNILILSKGRLCYGDSSTKLFQHFESIGFVIPEHINPADYLIDLTSVDTRTPEKEDVSLKRATFIADQWALNLNTMQTDNFKESHTKADMIASLDSLPNQPSYQSLGRAPFFRELNILIRRNLIMQYRDPIGFGALIFEALVLGLISGWLYFKPGTTLVGLRSIQASLYTASTIQAYLFLLYETYRLCQNDIKVYDRERSEGCISVTGWLLARRLSKLIIEDFLITLIYSLCTYFMFGLRTGSPIYFFRYLAGNFVCHMISMATAALACSITRDVAIATLICNLNFTFQTMTNGLYANAKTLPVYVRWCKYIAYQWYAFGYQLSNEFTDFRGASCFDKYPPDYPNLDQVCQAYTGKYILSSLGFWENWSSLPMGVMIAFMSVTFVAAGVVFKLKPVDITMGKEIKSDQDYSEDEREADEQQIELMNINQTEQSATSSLSMTLEGIYLKVKTRVNGNRGEKLILSNINAQFEAGKLNIIMGPSGSGKTSLLNLISGRLASSLFVKYSSSGSLSLNDYKVDEFDDVRPICSYVLQDDDHLISTLTVRETLQLSARLRLANHNISRTAMYRLVDSLILEMGLRDCANTFVGNELLKGISGGEKRRLSIAIQLISYPKVLILDEPTSGLDSFTAASIIECLESLALKKGTTVIMTIHQPRTLDQFGSILLLAKGGEVAFNGTQSELISHFSTLGYPVPKFTNIGDFIIDMISYSTSNENIEFASKKRVQEIIDYWKQNCQTEVHFQEKVIETKLDSFDAHFSTLRKKPAPFLTGLSVLAYRQYLSHIRDKNLIIAKTTQVIGMGVILALFFARLKHDNASVQNRLGVIQQIVSLYFTGILNNMAGYPLERDYFYDEFVDGVVKTESFFVSYLLIEIPFEIVSCLVFAVLMMFVVGFQYNAGLFFALAYCSWLVVNAGESLGLSFNTVLTHPGFALTVISIFCSCGVVMSGLLAMTLGKFLKAVNYTSPAHYCVMIVAKLVFTKDLKFYCKGDESLSDGSCLFENGEDVMQTYGLQIDLKLYLVLIAVVTVLHRVIAYWFLKLKMTKVSLSKMAVSSP